MKEKHGLSQYRLNYAKDYAQSFLETVTNIEMVFHMSEQGLMDEKLADIYISRNIEEIDMDWAYFKGYIEQREKTK